MSPVLEDDQANYYQNTVGQLIWAVELGWIDINLEISLLPHYITQPRHGNIEQVFHTLSFLKSHAKSKLVLDPFKNDFDGKFTAYDWEDLYGEVQEDFPENVPYSRKDLVTMTQFVDADHTGDIMNRCSHTGTLIYFCRYPILWYIKKHYTVESSMFGSKTMAMRTRMEITKGLHYKLRTMGVPINAPTPVFYDNKLVVTSTFVPTLTLPKKHLGICYHAVIKAVSGGTHWIVHIAGEFNPADVLTKILTAAVKRPHIGRIFY